MKTLIVFYSFSGKTGIVAKALKECLEAEVVEIEDKKGRKGFSGMMSLMKDTRSGTPVEITPDKVDMTGYDRVLLGGPNWGSQCPATVNSFIDANDFKGKDIFIFVVQAGMGAKKVFDDITGKVEKRGGKVKDYFSVSTFLRSKKRIHENATGRVKEMLAGKE